MSLDGAKIICLNDSAADQAVPARGRTFKFGYYMDCDVILEHPEALGLQCTIDCDAFGRVTIENRCPEQAITINGKVLKKMRPLLHNTEICIFDKKFLWIFEKSSQMVGFQMEDAIEFTTPCKKMKKAEQPPNSEPPRRWRTQFPKRLTIHSFAYWIKAGESPQDVEVTTDENKPRNTSEKLIAIESEPVLNKRLSSSTSFASDLIDLKTPKARLGFAGPKTLLSCCNLSGTVITSYSPRETAVRSSAGTPTKSTDIPDVTVSLFQHFPSPLAKNYRPSMHLIDLTTPKKQISLAFSPKRTLLKSALKKNIPKGKDLRTKSISSSTQEIASTSMDSVYSIHSTDDESVIELSDEGSFSPSPVVRMSPRSRTPQSLMKRAILSSVKKTAITKRLQQKLPARPLTSITLKNPQQTSGVRIQCHSTPHHKSVERLRSPPSGRSVKDSHSVSGKAPKPIITSTPFRARQSTATLRSPSTSLTGVKNKSRTSFMLKQALSKSPQKGASQKRKSLSFLEASVSVPEQSCARKSVSFLDRIESEQTLNQTFTIEDQVDETEVKTNLSNEEKNSENERCDEESSKLIKDKKGDCSALASILISDEKMSFSNLVENRDKPHKHNTKTNILEVRQSAKSNVTFSPPKTESMSVADMPAAGDDTEVPSVLLPTVNLSSKLGKNDGNGTVEQICLNLTFSSEGNVNSVAAHPEDEPTEHSTLKARHSTVENLDLSESPIQQTLQSLKSLKHNIVPTVNTIQPVSTEILHRDENIVEGEDFDGLDAIFKTPKARNLMILSSPKSISLQKPTTDSVELVHSTEFDLGASLEDIFRTPQSEFITNRGEADTTKAAEENVESFSPEEAFDMLVGRPINRRSYVRKTSPKQQQFLPLLNPKNAAFPKTDIEEWIADVNKSNELLDTDQYEDEMSYLTATRSEFSHDPLMSSSISGSVNTKAKRKQRVRSPTDESPMTIEVDDDEEENVEKEPVLKDPLEISSPKKSVSPNISGIDLLDHTSESLFSETLAVSDESSGKETEKTIGFAKNKQDDKVTCVETDIVMSTDKAHKEMEQAFENFEKGRRILDGKRLVSTPDPKKVLSKHTSRRTLGNQQTLDVFFNLKTLKTEREMEVAFENFTKQPKKITGERLARTPELVKPTEKKKMRKTMGNQTESEGVFDLDAAKTEREMQLAFENFEDIPKFLEERAIQTPQPKKRTREDHMRTMGSSMVPEFKLDLKAEKLKHEKKPSERLVQTSESKKSPLKVHGKTLGTSSPEVKLINNTNADHEMELVFENFEEEPTISKERLVQTPEPKKASQKDHRRTMGTSLVPDVKLDLKAAKAEREMELAFENFEEEPTISKERMVQTPEPKKSSLKDHRRTMGTSLVPDVKLDLKAAKAEREMELAFENFQEEPTIFKDRMVKTPEQKRSSLKDHRRTMGTSLVSEVKLDLKAAKAERELELAFENFENEPTFSTERIVQTPESKKTSLKDHRRTMGTSLVPDVKLDLKAAKVEREMELAFENFEEEPTISKERMVQTPEPKKSSLKDHRRTMGTSLVPDVKLDLKAAKAEREMELAFENFEEDPTISKERKVQTPEQKRSSLKDHRRTMGTSLVSEVKLDLKAARAEREMELVFENFEEEPTISKERMVQTPEPKKMSLKDYRRTMGTSLVPDVKLDLKAAKAKREMELAFENFEEDPTISMERKVQTPEQKRSSLKDHRRTMGTSLVSEVKLDLKAARAQREMELAFENFEEEPIISKERMVQTPEPKKMSLKDHRRTMGTSLVPDVKLDLKAAKAKREMELAFENFEEDPTISMERKVQTPEQKRSSLKDHRRTMGTSLVSEVKLDLKAAKAEREMELAFENFEEDPTISMERKVQTPEQKRSSLKDHRRTMGTSLVSEVKLDLKAARAEREMELAFENFEEEPIISKERMVQTPEPKKMSLKDHRRTMGTSLVPDVKLDLKAAKAKREMELAFENFEEDPTISKERKVQTPEQKRSSLKDHRRTMGTSLVSEVKLDLKAARAEREMELAFENFQDEPTISKERKVQTPEQKRSSLKDHRRTMGTSLVSEVKLDLKAARAQREMELAFENFEEEPIISKERMVQTPEPKKTSLKDHRRTMGTSLVPDVKLDLKAAKAEREMELAFENFEEDPTISKKRIIQTPEPKKSNKTSSLTSINCDTDDVLTSYKVKQLTENEKAAKCQRHVTDEEMLLQTMAEPKTVALSMIDKDVQPQQSSEGVQPEEITLAYTADTRAGKLLSETIDISIDKKNKFKEGVEDGGHPSQTSEFYEKFIEESHEEQCRNIRKSQTPVDNAEKTENQSMQNVTAAPTTSQSRPRRGRQNTIDNAQQLNENKYDLDVKITQKRTRRQNSVDVKQMPQDKSIGHVTKPQEKVESVVAVADKCENSPKIGEQNQTIHEDSNINRKSMTQAVVNKMDERKSDQESNLNNEDFFIDTHVDRSEIYSVKEHNIVVKVDSTDVDSTEDESKRAPTTRKKRLRKVSALTAISSQTVSEIQHHLEPIEEERKIAATSTDREVIEDGGVELSSRPARRRGGRKDISAQKGVQQQETPKSVVSLKAEGDEIISSSPVSSNNRIRGRKAQLNVVLVESEPKSSSTAIGIEIMADTTEHFGISAGESETRSLHVKSEPAEDHLASEFQTSNTETFAAEEESTVLEGKINQLQSQRTNLEEVIPVTPAQVKRRGRKPALKAGSIESATLPLRRGRRGSVQQDSEVQVNKVDVKVVPSATREPNTDEEITEIETVKVERIDVEEMIPCTPVLLKTRGRKKAVKTQSIESTTPVIVLRKGRRGSIQQDSDVKPLGEEEVVACTPVALLKTRSHRAGSKLEAAESTPASLTSYRKGGRRVTNTEEADIEEVVASTPLRSKPRGRRAAVKSDPTETMKENSTPVQPVGRKRAVVKAIERSTPEVVPEHDMGVQALDADVGRVSESTPVLSKKRGRRPLLKVEDTAEHSIPVGLKDQTATIEQNIGVHIVQVAVAPFNTRGRRVALEPQLNGAEDLSSNQMIGQKIAAGQDSETNTDDDNIEKLIPSKKRGRQATLKSKSSAEENVQINVKESDAGIEEVIQPKKRGRPAAVKIELIESVKNSTPTRKRGQKEVVQEPTQVKSTETLSLVSNKIQADAEETLSLSCQVASQTRRRQANLKRESAGENLTPVKKRGRNVMNNISAHEANDIKSEKEEEYTDSDPVKAEINNKPIRRRRASAKQPTSAKISEVVSKEEQISLTDDVLIDKSEKQVVRSRRVASPSPSHADPQAEKAHTAHIESPKKPVRGRRAAPKKNSTVESISTTEEEQSVSAVRAKTTRGRKPIVEVSTSPDNIEVKENNKNTATGRRRKGNITADAVKAIVSSDKEQTVSEQVNKKPTRGKRGVQPTSETAAENSSQIVEESQPSSVTKKLARERKAIKDTNDEQQYQSEEAPKKPTRSRKAQEPEKKEEKTAAVPKRTNRRIVEVAAEPDQDHTPSKRLRRKPHILLSDEYVH